MTADEIVAYESLGQATHFATLKSLLDGVALHRRDRKGDLPDDTIAQRLASYEKCQRLVRDGLSAGDLRSFLHFGSDEPVEEPHGAWQSDDFLHALMKAWSGTTRALRPRADGPLF